MDARQAKTQVKLHAAVLELAATRRAEDIGMTELAATAQVHRSTVYEFAASPADLLRGALEAQLDEVRATYLGDLTAEQLPRAIALTTRAVLVHVQQHAEIYRRGLAAGGALHDFLRGHFEESARLLLQQGMPVPPGIPPAIALGYVADGTVGAIAGWLSEPQGDPDAFLELFAQLVPPWWPLERG